MLEKNILTLDEVSLNFGYSKNSILTNFKRTAAAIEKKYNVVLIKIKDREEGICYEIVDGRAKTIEEEKKKVKIN